MRFTKIDRETWERREYFEHYFSSVPCTYSLTAKLDITPVKENNQKLYPTMLHSLTTVVNRHPEFRTAIRQNGDLGVYSEMVPCYTVFHPDTETFSTLWTDYAPDFDAFCRAYERDRRLYGQRKGLIGKPGAPENCFDVSMIPWTTFEGFHLHLQKGYTHLLPIFTMGKYYTERQRLLLPLAVQVHHAVCDGYHVGRFINELQEQISR